MVAGGVVGCDGFGGGSGINFLGFSNSSGGIIGQLTNCGGIVVHPPASRKVTSAVSRQVVMNFLDDLIALLLNDLRAVTILHDNLLDHLGLTGLFRRDHFGDSSLVLIPRRLYVYGLILGRLAGVVAPAPI